MTGNAGQLQDRRLMLWLGGAILLLIVVVSVFAPVTANNDPRPSSYNTAPGGAKAAYLMLQNLHRPVARWERPLSELANADAAHTTLVLAAPQYTALEKDVITRALQAFLSRGGRVLVTGLEGALLLPGGAAAVKPSHRLQALCFTQPEGPGALARAGEVEIRDNAFWETEAPGVFVEQRCGTDAVVVRLHVGAGEAIWWSSASPLTNAELPRDPDLRLLLASLGEGRRVLFDESLHDRVETQWNAAAGLPLLWVLGQALLVFALLVFSFSRRRGPVRLPVTVPRSSPLEFAVSMGDLYARAGATGAATEAARRRLERVMVRDAGLPEAVVKAGPDSVVAGLTVRFGAAPHSWREVGEHLREAAEAADVNVRPASALKLVQALGADVTRVRGAMQPASGPARGRAGAQDRKAPQGDVVWETGEGG